MTDKTLKAALRAQIKRHGSQKAAALALGVSRSAFIQAWDGTTEPRDKLLEALGLMRVISYLPINLMQERPESPAEPEIVVSREYSTVETITPTERDFQAALKHGLPFRQTFNEWAESERKLTFEGYCETLSGRPSASPSSDQPLYASIGQGDAVPVRPITRGQDFRRSANPGESSVNGRPATPIHAILPQANRA